MDRNLEDIDSLSVARFAVGGPVGQMPAAQPIEVDGPLSMALGGLIDINSLSTVAFAEGGEARSEDAYTEAEIARMREAMQMGQPQRKESESPTRQAVKRIIPRPTAQGPQQPSTLSRQQLYALPPYSLDMAGKLGRVGPIRRAEGSPELGEISNEEFINKLLEFAEQKGLVRNPHAEAEDEFEAEKFREGTDKLNRQFAADVDSVRKGAEDLSVLQRYFPGYKAQDIGMLIFPTDEGDPKIKSIGPDGWAFNSVDLNSDKKNLLLTPKDKQEEKLDIENLLLDDIASVDEYAPRLKNPDILNAPVPFKDLMDPYYRGTQEINYSQPVVRAEGSPEYGEVAEQMTVGTLPMDQGPQGPSLASQGLDLLKQAGKTVYGNLREAVTDPVAFNKRALGNVAQQLQSDPQEFIMNWTGGGLGGVIKPKGGVFPKAQTGSGIDNYLQRVQETLARDAAGDLTIGQIKTINKFIEDKGRKYLTTTYGTGDDVLKEALFQGRMPALGTDKKTFREYMLREARSGNPEALQDFERLYDVRAGINPYVVTPSRYEAAEEIRDTASRQMLEKMKQEGVQEELIEGPFIRKVETESMLKDYSPEYQKDLARNLMNRELGLNRPVDVTDETLIRAAQEGEVFYDLPVMPSLDFLDVRNLAKSLSTLNPDKLNNMSFAEAVVQGTKNTKLQRDWDEVIKKVEGNKSIPKELYDIGTENIRPMGEDRWVRLTTAQAVQLEGAAMHHSVGGYARKGDYGVGGLDALLSGKAQVFSLRGKDGRPRITIEAQKNEDGTLIVRQVKGDFNGVPEPQDQERVVEFLKGLPIDKIQPDSYTRSATGEDLPERVRIDWSDKAGFGARSIF